MNVQSKEKSTDFAGNWGLMLCIQTLSQRHSCQSVSMFEDEKTRDRSPRVFII